MDVVHRSEHFLAENQVEGSQNLLWLCGMGAFAFTTAFAICWLCLGTKAPVGSVCAWIGNAQATTSHPQYELSAISLTVTLTFLILTPTALILTLISLTLTVALIALTLTVTLTASDEAPRSSMP